MHSTIFIGFNASYHYLFQKFLYEQLMIVEWTITNYESKHLKLINSKRTQ